MILVEAVWRFAHQACRDFLALAQAHSKRWQKALQAERDQRVRLEETLEQLAKQHNHLERAFRGANAQANATADNKGKTLGYSSIWAVVFKLMSLSTSLSFLSCALEKLHFLHLLLVNHMWFYFLFPYLLFSSILFVIDCWSWECDESFPLFYCWKIHGEWRETSTSINDSKMLLRLPLSWNGRSKRYAAKEYTFDLLWSWFVGKLTPTCLWS